MPPENAPEVLPPLTTTLMRLEDRNAKAQEIIQSYARLHAGMDVAVGFAGLLPGAAIPALIAAIAAQSPIIYQPMARDLAALYTVDEKSIPSDIEQIQGIVRTGSVQTGLLDIATEFGTEFMTQIGGELLTEAGLGVLGSICIPVLGGVVGAALDYLIANMMTWRVGAMVSMYYQNGGEWLSSRHATFEMAKSFTGGIARSVDDVLNAKKRQTNVRVDLNSLRSRVPQIAEAQLRTVASLIDMMKDAMNHEQIRAALLGKGIPVDLIDKALIVGGKAVSAVSR